MAKMILSGDVSVRIDGVELEASAVQIEQIIEEVDVTAFGHSIPRKITSASSTTVEVATVYGYDAQLLRDRQRAKEDAPAEVAKTLESLYALDDALPDDQEAIVAIVGGEFQVRIVPKDSQK